ncbi:MAG: Clp protease ClpP, partial [Fusobacterium mortiferum]|nr:Clp protease ClpP [Fusobacterium mortiferum]
VVDGENRTAACLDGLTPNDKMPEIFKAKLNKIEKSQSENKEELKRIELEKAKLKLRLKMED